MQRSMPHLEPQPFQHPLPVHEVYRGPAAAAAGTAAAAAEAGAPSDVAEAAPGLPPLGHGTADIIEAILP